MQAQQALVQQAGQLAGAPMIDPSKNPEALAGMNDAAEANPVEPT